MNWDHYHQHFGFQNLPLLPLSALYALGWWGYEAIYKLGIKKPEEPHRPVVVVGNLSTGGTGKTPTVIAIAKMLRTHDRQVVLSASGYGSPRSRGATLAPDGALDPAEWGDEPAELREALPDIPLIVGRARVEAARICHNHFPEAVLLLDDGLQHKPLKHHIPILLDPEWVPNPFVLPAGPYREPRSHRTRFPVILPGDGLTIWQCWLVDPQGAQVTLDPGTEVQLLTAIGQPMRVVNTLDALGLKLDGVRVFPDHHPLNEPKVLEGLHPNRPLVVTRKDWVKLRKLPNALNFRVMIVSISLGFSAPEEFQAWLFERIENVKPQTD